MSIAPVFGAENIRNEILGLLKAKNISFQHMVHKETDQYKVAEEIGVTVNEGVKSLIVRGKKSGTNYLVCILGHQRINMKSLPELVAEACEFEKPETIKEKFGLDVRGVPPFGSLLGIHALFEQSIQDCDNVVFSPGLMNETIRMKAEDFIKLLNPQFAALAQL